MYALREKRIDRARDLFGQMQADMRELEKYLVSQ